MWQRIFPEKMANENDDDGDHYWLLSSWWWLLVRLWSDVIVEKNKGLIIMDMELCSEWFFFYGRFILTCEFYFFFLMGGMDLLDQWQTRFFFSIQLWFQMDICFDVTTSHIQHQMIINEIMMFNNDVDYHHNNQLDQTIAII